MARFLNARYGNLILLIGIWVSIIMVFIIWGAADVIRAHGRAEQDAIDHSEDYRSNGGIPEVRAQLTPRGDPEIMSAVLFRRDLTQRTREIEYEARFPQQETAEDGNVAQSGTNPALQQSPLETHVGQFIDVGASRELDNRWISATAEAWQNRVLLRVNFDRRSGALGAPGTYVGTISIVDPQVERLDIPFTVSLVYPWWQFVCVLLLVMLLPATLYLWLLRGSFIGGDRLTVCDLQEWLFSRNALMSFGTGVAAAVSVWLATYFSSDAWGASITAATAMFGATFSAFIAAATAVTAAGADQPGAAVTAGGADQPGAAVTAGGADQPALRRR